jgi:hypothetical protein
MAIICMVVLLLQRKIRSEKNRFSYNLPTLNSRAKVLFLLNSQSNSNTRKNGLVRGKISFPPQHSNCLAVTLQLRLLLL